MGDQTPLRPTAPIAAARPTAVSCPRGPTRQPRASFTTPHHIRTTSAHHIRTTSSPQGSAPSLRAPLRSPSLPCMPPLPPHSRMCASAVDRPRSRRSRRTSTRVPMLTMAVLPMAGQLGRLPAATLRGHAAARAAAAQVARRGQEVLEAALSKKQLKRMDLRCVRVLRRLWHVPCTKASVYKSNDIYPAWNKHAHGSWAKPQRAPLKTNDHALTGPLEVTFGLIHYPPPPGKTPEPWHPRGRLSRPEPEHRSHTRGDPGPEPPMHEPSPRKPQPRKPAP